jgi:Calcineurin-like phosphoesterase
MRTLITNPTPNAPRFSKARRHYLDPIAAPKNNPRFEKPPMTNNVNLILPLRAIVPDVAEQAQSSGRLVFHITGDSGCIHGDETQVAVAEAMEKQIADTAGATKPGFCYHVGDVVYFNGQSEFYSSQFYEPYKYYPGPIFAIPGNHDGDTSVRPGDTPDTEPTLTGFIRNFCTAMPEHISPYRPTMTQPYVYWVLDAPLVQIIGLYSNVEGTLDGRGTYEQQKWLEQQLAAAKQDRFIVVAVHHPPYSLDSSHGGSPDIAAAIDQAIATTNVVPHAVLSGHVHNYQRFTRNFDGREIPYVIEGRGGYANSAHAMHRIQKGPDGHDPTGGTKTRSDVDPELNLTFEHVEQDSPGFVRVTATAEQLLIEAFNVPFGGGFDDAAIDTVAVTRDGRITSNEGNGNGNGAARPGAGGHHRRHGRNG